MRIGVLAGLLLGVSGGHRRGGARARPGNGPPRHGGAGVDALPGVRAHAACLPRARQLGSRRATLRCRVDNPAFAARGAAVARAAGADRGSRISLAYLTFWWRDDHRGASTAAAMRGRRRWPWWSRWRSACCWDRRRRPPSRGRGAARRQTQPCRAVRLSLRASLAIALLGAAASAAVLASARPVRPADDPPPCLVVKPTGLRVLVVALDGGTRRPVRVAAHAGPDLLARDLACPICGLSAETSDPAREWVTIATGQSVSNATASRRSKRAGWPGWTDSSVATRGSHWTSTLTAARTSAADAPNDQHGSVRREKTFWEVGAQAGLRTLALNWWTSWPARGADGTVLSERAVLRLELGAPWPARSCLPSDLRDAARAVARDLGTGRRDGRRVLGPTGGRRAGRPTSRARSARQRWWTPNRSCCSTRSTVTRLDLATLYLPGLDILAPRSATEQRRRNVGTARWGPATRSCATPAGSPSPRPGDRRSRHRVEPLLVAHTRTCGRRRGGPPVQGEFRRHPTTPSAACSVFDIAPTVLRALGVPLSKCPSLPGKPLLTGCAQRVLARAARNRRPGWQTYGRRGVARRRGTGPGSTRRCANVCAAWATSDERAGRRGGWRANPVAHATWRAFRRLRPEEALFVVGFVPSTAVTLYAYACGAERGMGLGPTDRRGPGCGWRWPRRSRSRSLGRAARGRDGRPRAGVADFYRTMLPFVLCIAVYTNLHDTVRFVNPHDIHHYLLAAGSSGCSAGQPVVWAEAYITRGRTEFFNLFYASFFLIGPSAVIVLWASGKRVEARETLLGLIVCFYTGYLLYVIFPAAPPRLYMESLGYFTVDLRGGPISNFQERAHPDGAQRRLARGVSEPARGRERRDALLRLALLPLVLPDPAARGHRPARLDRLPAPPLGGGPDRRGDAAAVGGVGHAAVRSPVAAGRHGYVRLHGRDYAARSASCTGAGLASNARTAGQRSSQRDAAAVRILAVRRGGGNP